jgi:hypothetical protein
MESFKCLEDSDERSRLLGSESTKDASDSSGSSVQIDYTSYTKHEVPKYAYWQV